VHISLSQTCAAARTHVLHTVCVAAPDEYKLSWVPDLLGVPDKRAGKV